MMMKFKWVVLFSLGLVALPASAVDSTVINSQSIGEPPATSTPEAKAPAEVDAQAESQSEANKAQALKGGKKSLRERRALAKSALSDSNKQEGPAFLEANKAKPGVVSLASGVQYKILKSGKGKNPTDSSLIICRYHGTLIDGTVIDKTDDTQPAPLKVEGFLPGLKEAVKLMSPGAKWQIVIPPQLAYGDKGLRGVGPNAVLIYDMEIVSVK